MWSSKSKKKVLKNHEILTVLAKTPGKTNNIRINEAKVPSDIVSHILAAMAEANPATIRVTIIRMEDELIIV